MNTYTLSGSCGLLVATLAAPVAAQDAQHQEHKHIIVHTDGDHEHTHSHSVSVSLDDGDVQVVVNGEVIPEDRIKEEDGRLIILDEDGNEMESVNIHVGGDDFPFGVVPDLQLWRADDGHAFAFAGDMSNPPVMLGLTMGNPGAALASHLGFDAKEATLITGVYEGLPAYEAGLREFDIVVAVDGDEPADPQTIRKVLEDMEDGDRLRLKVISKGSSRNVSVRVDEWDAEAFKDAEYLSSNSSAVMGRLRTLGPGMNIVPDMSKLRFTPKGDFFVTPPAGMDIEKLKGQALEWREKFGDSFITKDPKDPKNSGERLDSLKDRMKDLESMLDRLLDEIEVERSKNQE